MDTNFGEDWTIHRCHVEADGHHVQVYVTGEYIEWEYHHLRVNGQWMWIHPSGWASMIEISASPNTEAPWWRLPTVGGGNVLRTAPAHRWRDEFLPSGFYIDGGRVITVGCIQ